MKFNNETIRTAVKEWLDDPKKAEKKYGHISNWDVSNVTDMESLFERAKYKDLKLNTWNYKFMVLNGFNEDISNWDVSNVNNMKNMFLRTEYALNAFNKDIGCWDVSKVTNMQGMFAHTESFNQDIGDWDVSNVTNMKEMFAYAQDFNQDIGRWDVGQVTNMYAMFRDTESFNQNLGDWNISEKTNIEDMFYGFEYTSGTIAISSNKKISSWNWMSKSNIKKTGLKFKSTKNDKLKQEEEEQSIWINTELFTVILEDDKEFEAIKLSISFIPDSDGEHELVDKILDKLDCEYLIFTEIKNNEGEYELQRIIDLPEIHDLETQYKDCGDHGPFSTDEEVIDYVEKLETISFKDIDN